MMNSPSSEVWLRPNRRALGLAMVAPLSLAMLGIGLGVVRSDSKLWLVCGGLLATLGFFGLLGLIRLMVRPRLAFQDDHLLVYLKPIGQPFRVPIDIVEVFFAGQGPSMMPRQVGQADGQSSESANVVVRLAEAAKSWQQRSVDKSLGHWCEGYITIRGAWCEPLGEEVLRGLNRRLIEQHRRLRESSSKNAPKSKSTPSTGSPPTAENQTSAKDRT